MSNFGKDLHVELLVVFCEYLNSPASLLWFKKLVCAGHREEDGG
jgi:hypothetical protein